VPPDPALAKTLRRLREERGYSQEALGHESGLTLASIARIETGKSSPAWSTVRAIAKALDVTLAELGAAVEAE
jgi:transcriptional regulator with XRE-family HTH domain